MIQPRAQGFTLIELMIAVCIIGVLASVAIPTYGQFVMASKASEVPANLSIIYRGAAAYWEAPHSSEQGVTAATVGHCIVSACCGSFGDITLPPLPPTPQKRTGDWGRAPAAALNFAPAGPVYGAYAWGTPFGDMSVCGLTEQTLGSPWALIAFGITDLDGDGQFGGASLMAGIRDDHYYRATGYGTVADGLRQLYGIECPMCAAGD